MVEDETYETEKSPRDLGDAVCCPRCKSKDIIIRESKDGYFWIESCNNCGYRGKEGDAVGCIKKNGSLHIKEDTL